MAHQRDLANSQARTHSAWIGGAHKHLWWFSRPILRYAQGVWDVRRRSAKIEILNRRGLCGQREKQYWISVFANGVQNSLSQQHVSSERKPRMSGHFQDLRVLRWMQEEARSVSLACLLHHVQLPANLCSCWRKDPLYARWFKPRNHIWKRSDGNTEAHRKACGCAIIRNTVRSALVGSCRRW